MSDDYSVDVQTTGTVAVDDTARGNIGSSGDRDWFAVELEAGRTYTIDLRGSRTNDGTLSDPYLRGIYDAGGNLISGTGDDDGGEGRNSRVTFTATESGIHYIAAGAFSSYRGTYELEVTDSSPADDPPVSDVDEAPSFGQQGYTFALAENTDGSTDRVSLGTVSATDPESATLSYSLVGGNESGSFEIDAASGELFYTGGGEDFESGSTQFELMVRASDGDQSADTAVTVNVTDVEEADSESLVSVSEPGGSDLPEGTSTTGRVEVDGTAAGEIQHANDRDWFAVELEAGRTYRINTDGVQSGGGTLARARLHNVYDADGNEIPGIDDEPITWRPIHYLSPQEVRNLDGLAFFTPDEDGTYYLEVEPLAKQLRRAAFLPE